MSELDQELPEVVEDELTLLKARADLLGVKYHPSISAEKLREKVAAHLTAGEVAEPKVTGEVESEAAKRRRVREEALKLIRVNVTCMNPAKKEWEGEIFTAGNGVIPTVKKYVPFNTDEGYHVPQILLNQILQRKCQVFTTEKDSRGNRVRKGKLIKEFAVEVLPPLTEEELKDLAQRQAMSGSIG